MGKNTGTYSGYNGEGMSYKEALQKVRDVESLNFKVGATNRKLEIEPMSGSKDKYRVVERFK